MRAEELPKMLVDDPKNAQFQVSRRVFTEQAILDQELERIFEGSWVYLAHESQLPAPGDFLALTWAGNRSSWYVARIRKYVLS